MEKTKLSGIATICTIPSTSFPSPDIPNTNTPISWWQGYFIHNKSTTFGLMGTLSQNPPTLHPCCVSATSPPVFWDVSIFNYETKQTWSGKNVIQVEPESDYLKFKTEYTELLECEDTGKENNDFGPRENGGVKDNGDVGLTFETTSLKVDQEALDGIKKYFPEVYKKIGDRDLDCTLCLGKMTVSGLDIEF
ncbi:hypothetical protein HK098_005382 [Nowakowskiella sp. JEL0407]|nr:hypothetical protein HK098_005382 [Nowakowskiella sp. JEL0407]